MARSMTAEEVRKLIDIKREYMNDWEVEDINGEYKSYADAMIYGDENARMLIQALECLEATGGLDFAVLKHPTLGSVWGNYTKERERQRKRTKALDKLKSTLTKEEIKILGIGHIVQ